MQMRRSLLLFMIGILAFSSLWAQGIIPGRVTDEEGRPIAGVSVLIKGTKTGTITDKNGNFSIQLVSERYWYFHQLVMGQKK